MLSVTEPTDAQIEGRHTQASCLIFHSLLSLALHVVLCLLLCLAKALTAHVSGTAVPDPHDNVSDRPKKKKSFPLGQKQKRYIDTCL